MQHADTLEPAPLTAAPAVEADLSPEAAQHARLVLAEAEILRARRDARRVVAAEDAAASTLRADLLDATRLDELPHPEPLIEGVLNRHSYAILRGRDHTFKSFLALDWALSLGCGRPWLGHHTERVPVLFVAAEGAYGLAARRAAWEAHHGVTVPPGALTVLPRGVDLFTGAEVPTLLDVVREGGYGLIVLDTLRRVSGRADGNGSDMAVVVDRIDELKRATAHGSVLVLSHTDKADRDTRGFSGIEDDADQVWALRRDEDGQTVEALLAKNKDGADGTRLTLRPQAAGPSIVLAPDAHRLPEGSARSRDEQAILERLDAVSPLGEELTAKEVIAASGVGRTRGYDALARLVKVGAVTRCGTAARPRYRRPGGAK